MTVRIFRAHGRIGDQETGPGIHLERVEEKPDCAGHQGVDRAQVGAVTVIVIMVPQIDAQPSPPAGPKTEFRAIDRSGRTPQIGIVMGDPPARAIHRLRSP